MDSKIQKQILDFLYQVEGLKTKLRHSWLSSGRRESVAEHTWRMALMVILLAPYLTKKINQEKALKMVIVHDLVEVKGQDYVAFKKKPENKTELERVALKRLVRRLPFNIARRLISLWEEYEANQTKEAWFVKSLDKMEVLIQHMQSNIKTQTRKELRYNLVHGEKYCQYDKFIRSLKKLIRDENIKYYQKNKVKKEFYL